MKLNGVRKYRQKTIIYLYKDKLNETKTNKMDATNRSFLTKVMNKSKHTKLHPDILNQISQN